MIGRPPELYAPRLSLRPLRVEDYNAWREVRIRARNWLTKWEPQPLPGHPDPTDDKRSFATRCNLRDREWQIGAGYGFGVFVDGAFAGELNVNNVQRGPFQNALVGYWIDEARAGHGYMPEAVARLFQFSFEELDLHRLEISIIPRNGASRRVAEKLDLREEGTALRYLEINGVWEDHVRYGITVEDWSDKRDFYMANFLTKY